MTPERLRQVLDYNPTSGVFVWRVYKGARGAIGVVAGNVSSRGYVRIRVDKKEYFAHRLAWLYVYGVWPSDVIDHINEVKHDNRISNLRDTDEATNASNQSKARRDSASGLRGAMKHKKSGLWQARIVVRGKRFNLGYFKSAESAHAAYVAAKRLYALGS